MTTKLKSNLILSLLACAGLIQANFLPAEQASGFTLAYIVFFFLAIVMLYALARIGMVAFQELAPFTIPAWQSWAVPLLALAGLGVAGYLSYVETQMVAAICGPVGDCNAVQSSAFARLFGVLPVALLGLGAYIAILLAWGWGHYRKGRLARLAGPALYAMTFLGVLYSLYLTYLELYVINAVCIWCLSSAVIMGLLLFLSVQPMRNFLSVDEEDDEDKALET